MRELRTNFPTLVSVILINKHKRDFGRDLTIHFIFSIMAGKFLMVKY